LPKNDGKGLDPRNLSEDDNEEIDKKFFKQLNIPKAPFL
jgi:hypothetical protein